MKVKATALGFYDHVRRRPGNVFRLTKDEDFTPLWMVEVPEDTPELTTPVGPIKDGHVPDFSHPAREPVAMSQVGGGKVPKAGKEAAKKAAANVKKGEGKGKK